MTKHLYGIIYHRSKDEGRPEEWVSSVCFAESYFDAERAAEKDRAKHWPGHHLHSVAHLTHAQSDDGEVFMVSAT